MNDIAPALWDDIEGLFRWSVEGDPEIDEILQRIERKKATHIDTQKFAIQIGEHASNSLTDIIKTDVLPDRKMHYNIAQRTVRPMMELIRDEIQEVAVEVQENLNQDAGIGMKAIDSPGNDGRIVDLVNKLCSADDFETVKWLLGAPIRQFAQSIVDDFIRDNAEFQYKAGLHPKIRRILGGKKPCERCQMLAGTYDYPDGLPEMNIFQRHENCKCLVVYDPGDGRRQNVHTKKWLSPDMAEPFRDAMGFSEPVTDPLTGNPLRYVEGMKPEYPPDWNLAGKGRKKNKIRKIEDLVENYGGKPSEWVHKKAFYWVYDKYGEERQVSIHWFEAPGCGKHEGFVKIYDGKVYRDEYETS